MPSYAEEQRRRRAEDQAFVDEFKGAVISIFAVLDLTVTPEQISVTPYDECRLVSVNVNPASLPVSLLIDNATFRAIEGANFCKRVCDLAGKVREALAHQ